MSKDQYIIDFDPVEHKYTRNGVEYTSATTIIGKYKKEFDKRFWSMYSTLKEDFFLKVRAYEDEQAIEVNGVLYTLRELYSCEAYAEGVCKRLGLWDDITVKACARGNKIHDYLEDTNNLAKGDPTGSSNSQLNPLKANQALQEFTCVSDLDTTDLQEVYPEVYHVLTKYIKQGCTIFVEKKVFIDKYLVSGMIDCLVVKGRQFMIIDWKTNKDVIHTEAGYYKKVFIDGAYVKSKTWSKFPKFLLEPVAHLQECKGTVYGLQLSLYAFILESWGYNLLPNGLILFHFRPNERPRRLPMPYYKKEIFSILEHHRKNRM